MSSNKNNTVNISLEEYQDMTEEIESLRSLVQEKIIVVYRWRPASSWLMLIPFLIMWVLFMIHALFL